MFKGGQLLCILQQHHHDQERLIHVLEAPCVLLPAAFMRQLYLLFPLQPAVGLSQQDFGSPMLGLALETF
jgi:hypothetical protein